MKGPLKKARIAPIDISGFQYVSDFITVEEERQLIQSIDSAKWNTSISRRTQHYGYIYDYKSKEAAQKTDPIPDWSIFLIDRLMERGLLTNRPDQLIVNEYQPGQGIASHTDNAKFFDDGIVSISLESAYPMEFKKSDNTVTKVLERRSALILHGEARYEWRHGIVARKEDYGIPRKRRISLTFRKMKQ